MKLLILFVSAGALVSGQAQPVLMPYSPNVIQDQKGNEWYIEQNGGLQRNGSQPSMIGNAMTLQVGTQQFYSQQPMISADGNELVMTSQQPLNGLAVTRRISVFSGDGLLRYVEEFTNTTARDMTIPVEMRHTLNNQNKGLMTDTGRVFKDRLAKGESGIMAIGNADDPTPNVLLMLCDPATASLPRINARGGYQFSVSYMLAIAAGQTVTLIHGIAQTKVGAGSKPDAVAKAFEPLQMRRLTKGVPKNVLKAAANLAPPAHAYALDDWFPASYWDIFPEASDILVPNEASRLKGRSGTPPAVLTTRFGDINLPWGKVAALAGPGFTGTGQSWLWLRDGQRWKGRLDPPSLTFTLTAGTELEVPRPNRIIWRKSSDGRLSPTPEQALVELWSGERVAIRPQGALKVDTAWGIWGVPWSEVLTLSPAAGDSLGGTLRLRDGTRLRCLPSAGPVPVKTADFGEQEIDFAFVRRIITPLVVTAPPDDFEPAESFVDLAGEQRLIGRVVSENLRIVTASGPVILTPAAVRELHEVADAAEPRPDGHFQADLWGGGTVTGRLDNSQLDVEGRGFVWQVPVSHLLRLVNPVPVTDPGLMRRTGDLVRELSHEDWKIRERATDELRELGPVVKTSLQEALRLSTDAEVTRRIESLLLDIE